jgi:Uma2 family endonuclease
MPVDIRLTYEDFCLLPDDGKRYEIIDGELFVTPSPRTLHQKVVTQLAYYLSALLKENPLGQVFVAPLDVVFSDFDVVEPDLVYVSRERASVLTEKNIQGAPDLVVEVLSETTEKRDLTLKLRLYARYGVKEYWIINPMPISGKICRRQGDRLELVSTLQADDSLTSLLFPGFSLPLRKLVE